MVVEKLPYPKSVFYIIANEFCERFSYYGMKAVLTIYLIDILTFNKDDATLIYHAFSMLCYFTPIIGAILADSYIGKFKTIFYLSVVYVSGNILLSLASVEQLKIPQVPFSLLGLGLIALGTGGIKPCVAAFGGDQFKLPEQENHLKEFFSVFYFSINAGSLISTVVTPIFRNDIQCNQKTGCFPVAFSVPAGLMIVALAIFLIGKPRYIIRKLDGNGNILMRVIGCISCAVKRKWSWSGTAKEHWLDHAEEKYEKNFIEDIKALLGVLFVYIPLPLFWTLFDQQGSRWTIQATNLNGVIPGFYTIKPDQFQVINPLLILMFIPIFDKVVYPLLGKCRLLKKPLQRMAVGMALSGLAFVVSGILELSLEKTYAVELHENKSSLNFVNTLPCNVELMVNGETKELDSYQNFLLSNVETKSYETSISIARMDSRNGTQFQTCDQFQSQKFNINSKSKNATSILIGYSEDRSKIAVYQPSSPEELEKHPNGLPKIRVIHYGLEKLGGNISIIFNSSYYSYTAQLNTLTYDSKAMPMEADKYNIYLMSGKNGTTFKIGEESVKAGGSYGLTLTMDSSSTSSNPHIHIALLTLTEPNSIHMVWLFPQYIIITAGEIMFSITGLEFAYQEAPASMKSVVQSAWLLTVGIGNLIVIIVVEAKFFAEQSKEFFLFAGLMAIDILIFAAFAYTYKPRKKNEENHNEEMKMTKSGNVNNAYDE